MHDVCHPDGKGKIMSQPNDQPRLNYSQQSSGLVRKLVEPGAAVANSGHIEQRFGHLVDIHAYGLDKAGLT